MKIRPDDISIPHDDPFRHDLLDRKTTILTLTNLLQNLETPYTMSIDASWGNGKTTFLKMWTQHLKNEGFPVVSFNAWESDFTKNPFAVLSANLLESLKEYEKQKKLSLSSLRAAIRNLNHVLVAINFSGYVTLAGTFWSIQYSEPSFLFIASALIWTASAFRKLKQVFSPLPDATTAVKSFKRELESVAKCTSKNHSHLPLVIAIDELDRCRPPFTIELLEIAKHLFSVNNIVFVLAVDKSQLVHSIKAIYGNDFDAIGYLRRFIDLDFQLPDPNRTNFMTHLMGQTRILQFFERYSGHSWGESADTQRLLQTFLSLPVLSIRQIQQAMHRLGIILASLDQSDTISYGAVAVLVILRTIEPVAYQRFVQSDMTDRGVSDQLFGLPGLQYLKSTKEGALFEALLAMGYCEFALARDRNPMIGTQSLFHHYCHMIDNPDAFNLSEDDSDTTPPPPPPHERRVIGHLRRHTLMLQSVRSGKPVGFNLTVQRLELFSDDLGGNNP